MASLAQSYHAKTSPGNIWDPRFPNGDKFPGLEWRGLPVLAGLVAGNPITINVRTPYLYDEDPGNTLITFETISGVSSNIWGDPNLGNNLTHPGTVSGPGIGFLRARRLDGLTIDSTPIDWSVVSSPTAIKTHQGYGVDPVAGIFQANSTFPSSLQTRLNELALMPNVINVVVFFYWGGIEIAKNVYQFGLLDQILQACQNAGKRLTICLQWSAMGGGTVDYNVSQGRFPAYLRDDYTPTGIAHVGNRTDACVFRLEIMDRYLAMCQAVSTHCDQHAWFEGIHTYDSVDAANASAPGYSIALKETQYKYCFSNLKTIFKRSNCFMSLDWGFSADIPTRQRVLQSAADNRMVMGSIDIMPRDYPPNLNVTNVGGGGFQSVYLGVLGGIDYRSMLAFGGRSAQNNMSGLDSPTPAQINMSQFFSDYMYPIWGNTYLKARWLWLPYTITGFSEGGLDNDHFWNTPVAGYTLWHPTIKEYLQLPLAQIQLNMTKPPNYGQVTTA